jgi:hypothetical protein
MRHPQAFGEKSGRPLGMIAQFYLSRSNAIATKFEAYLVAGNKSFQANFQQLIASQW